MLIFDKSETYKSLPPPKLGPLVLWCHTAYYSHPDLILSFKGELVELVKVKMKAVLSQLCPSIEDHETEVYPPKIKPLELFTTVRVFGFPSQREWNAAAPNQPRVPLHKSEMDFDLIPIKEKRDCYWVDDNMAELD